MTLCQFYDQHAKKMGHKTWNHFCAVVSPELKAQLKKQLKRDYKSQKENQ